MIYLKTYEKPEYNFKEIFRYMGCRDADDSITALVNECIAEIDNKLSFKICCSDYEIIKSSDGIDIGFIKTKSNVAIKNLENCGKIIVFAATIGLETDRLIARYGITSPTKSVIFQAIGAERIESLCDAFENDVKDYLKKHNKFIRPRFSAGYGDFDIEAQKNIFKVLDCERKIGLTLNDSMLMSPSKSVTAIIGISDKPKKHCKIGCSACDKTDCEYRVRKE